MPTPLNFSPPTAPLNVPPPSIARRKLGSASLQLLQHLNSVGAIQVQLLVSTVAAPNLLDNVVRVRGANDGDLRRQPLLKGFRNEVAVGGEPARQRGADVQLLLRVGRVGRRGVGHVALVDGDVLLGEGLDADL
jgi:hypothetical protein